MTILTERDLLHHSGRINWNNLRKIAMLRALVERDLDILVAAGIRTFPLPAGISQDNVREWRAKLASEVDTKGLTLTPFHTLYRDELKKARDVARALQAAQRIRREMVAHGVVGLPRIRLLDQMVKSIMREAV